MKRKIPIAYSLSFIGSLLIVISFVFLFFTFGPIIKQEIIYRFNKLEGISFKVSDNEKLVTNSSLKEKVLTPPNTRFSVVIPKIGAAAPVIANIDPSNPSEYQKALRKGVAHAKYTPYPGQFGNTYLFAHSTDAFYNLGRYNAVFYLLGKLEKGDNIFIYYENTKYTYVVEEVKVVNAGAVKYLGKQGEWNTLTLQTCYPPGTALRRLVVVANEVNEDNLGL